MFLALILLTLAMIWVAHRLAPTGVRGKFEQIQDGMTETRVEELLSGPHGAYDQTKEYHLLMPLLVSELDGYRSIWHFPGGQASFDRSGMGNAKHLHPPPAPSLLDRAKEWLKGTLRLPW